MNFFLHDRRFRLSSDAIACDEEGPRVAGVPLLGRDAKGRWALLDESHVSRDLSRVYGFPLDAGAKRAGLATIANALNDHDLAKAQMATLLLQLPDPPFLADGALVKSGPGRLAYDLVACGLHIRSKLRGVFDDRAEALSMVGTA